MLNYLSDRKQLEIKKKKKQCETKKWEKLWIKWIPYDGSIK